MKQSEIDRLQHAWILSHVFGDCLHVGCGQKRIEAAIVALANRPEMARGMAKDWQKKVWANYTYETQVDRWRDVILEVVENGA